MENKRVLYISVPIHLVVHLQLSPLYFLVLFHFPLHLYNLLNSLPFPCLLFPISMLSTILHRLCLVVILIGINIRLLDMWLLLLTQLGSVIFWLLFMLYSNSLIMERLSDMKSGIKLCLMSCQHYKVSALRSLSLFLLVALWYLVGGYTK